MEFAGVVGGVVGACVEIGRAGSFDLVVFGFVDYVAELGVGVRV